MKVLIQSQKKSFYLDLPRSFLLKNNLIRNMHDKPEIIFKASTEIEEEKSAFDRIYSFEATYRLEVIKTGSTNFKLQEKDADALKPAFLKLLCIKNFKEDGIDNSVLMPYNQEKQVWNNPAIAPSKWGNMKDYPSYSPRFLKLVQGLENPSTERTVRLQIKAKADTNYSLNQ